MTESRKPTKNQCRAEYAYQCIKAKQIRPSNVKDAYTRLAKKFPALVHSCGLAQAIAFIEAKEKENNVGSVYLQDLNDVMLQLTEKSKKKESVERDYRKLVEKSRTSPLMEYQELTREAIESATWLKRYSESLLEVKSPNDAGLQE